MRSSRLPIAAKTATWFKLQQPAGDVISRPSKGVRMRMDSTDFSILVGRLEREVDENPRAFALKVAIVAAFGYVPVALAAAGVMIAGYFFFHSFLAGQVSAIAALSMLAAGIALVATIRALIVRIDAPTGHLATRDEAPELFAAIDDVIRRTTPEGKKTRRVSIERITLDAEFDAGICQIPRWGVFGGYANHLHVGLPLLAALNVAELKTLIAHELGHLSGESGRLAAWIYRQRPVWQAVQRRFAEPKALAERTLAVFYRRHAPYFNAHAFVLARMHEYQADQLAAWATDAGVLARALIKVDLASRFLSEVFWERFYAQVERLPDPPYLPFTMMPRALSIAQKEWLKNEWLQQSLMHLAAEGDTHPSLKERLAALDIAPELPTHMPDKTALSLLIPHAAVLLKQFDTQWQASNADAWRKRHDAIKEARWKIAQYEQLPAEALKPADLWEKTMLLLDIGQESAALQELRALVILDPSAAKAQFLLGRMLLEAGDESGLQNLTLAAQGDGELLAPAGQLGYGYLMDRGRKGEAQRFWERCRAA